VSYSPFPPAYAAPGAAVPTDALQIGGTDGTDLRALATDSSGRLITQQPNNILLATTAISVTATVTTQSTTAAVDGQCVVVSVSCVTAKTMAFPVAVRVRDTTNGITTAWQLSPIQIAGGSATQLYFNLPVTNGDTVDLDFIAQGAVGASSTDVTAVLSPLSIPTRLRPDGRSLPLNTAWGGVNAGTTAATLAAAVTGWRCLLGQASAYIYGLAVNGGNISTTLNGGTIYLLQDASSAYQSTALTWETGLLIDPDVAVVGNGSSAGGNISFELLYDMVPE